MEETWRLLHPWRGFLRGLTVNDLTLVLRATLTDSDISTQDGRTFASHVAGLRHSLLLLLLLSKVDASMFMSILESHLGLQSRECRSIAATDLDARLELVLDTERRDLGIVSDMMSLFFSMHSWEANWSASFNDAIRQIANLGDPEQEHSFPVAIHIYVPSSRNQPPPSSTELPSKAVWMSIAHQVGHGAAFGLEFLDESQGTPYVLGADSRQAADESQEHFQCHGIFRVAWRASLEYDMHPLVCAVTLPANGICEAGKSGNLQTPNTMRLGLAGLAHDSDVTQLTMSLGRILVELLPTTSGCPMLETLHVMCEGNMMLLLGRLWSALAVTQCVKRVEISIEDYQSTWSFSQEDLLDCMLALFSKHGQSSISEVSLDEVCVTSRDADLVWDIVGSSDPTTTRHRHKGAKQIVVVPNPRYMLKTGAVFSLQAMQEREDIDPSKSWVLRSLISGARVIANDGISAEVDVLVPGYGLCRMYRAHLLPETCKAWPRSNVTSLALSLDARWQEVLASANLLLTPDGRWGYFYAGMGRLIEAIGAPLTSLEINMRWPPEACAFFSEVMNSCPKLSKLGLYEVDFDSTAFLECYRGSSVCLRDLECSTVRCSLRPLAAELSNPITRLYRSLKRLVCECNCEFANEAPEWLDAMFHMLEANRTLRHVVIRGNIADKSAINNRLQQFSGEIAIRPLPLQHRLALLSIFRTWNHEVKRYCGGPLSIFSTTSIDHDSMVRIIAFAGSWVNRNVELR